MLTEVAGRQPGERTVAILVEDLLLWILNQPHLNARIDNEFLRGFLRVSFFSLTETKYRIEMYYTLKNKMPSVFANRKVNQRLLDICKMGLTVNLPTLIAENGACVTLSRYANYNPNMYEFSEIMKVFFMLTEIQMMESRNEGPYSVVHIIDLKGATFRHCLQFDYFLIRKIVRLIKAGIPYHIKEIHIVNASNCFIWLLSVLSSFMSEKIRRKYHIHNSMESLYKRVPQFYLPKEYGGQNGSIQKRINDQMQKLMEYQIYFDKDDSYGINESLRRKKCPSKS